MVERRIQWHDASSMDFSIKSELQKREVKAEEKERKGWRGGVGFRMRKVGKEKRRRRRYHT